MKNKLSRTLLFLPVMALLVAGCKSTSKVSLKNLAYLYKPEKQFAERNDWVYNTSDSTSTLFVEVLFSNLVYQKDAFTGLYTCSYRLTYKLTNGYESGDILETNTILAGDSLNYGKNTSVVHSFDMKVKYPGKYLVEIELYDLNRGQGLTWFDDIDKTTPESRQNFMVLNQQQGLIYRSYIPGDEPFRIVTNNASADKLFVNYYHRDFPVARPPFLEDQDPEFKYKPDSTYQVGLTGGQTGWLTLDRPGFYHFRKDTLSREGLTLYRFYNGFPEIISAEQLRYPLRYITTRKEYDTLMNTDNIKAAVDNFWLKTARTPERAKILIQKYYSNVVDANRYFTSYLEGWKTDRGLIYIVFGEPYYVYRGKDSEEWIYGEPENRNSLRFTFVKVINPFTDNDYMLLRTPTLREAWFVTVQSWRR